MTDFEYQQRLANIESLQEAGFTEEEIEIILNADDPNAKIEEFFERR